jgi:hypothetical protein
MQFLWEKMFKSDHGKINCVKCTVCSIVKGKDVILGSKLFVLKTGKIEVTYSQ